MLRNRKSRIIIISVTTIVAVVLLAVIIGLSIYFSNGDDRDVDISGAVVSNGEECAKIGRNVLQKGGNAVDAAIATLFCEGLSMPQSMGLGGGFLMTVYKRSTNVAEFLVARERAPLKATEDMFERDPTTSSKGILSVAVPGELKGYWELYNKYGGGVPWSTIVDPSIEMCQNGVTVTQYFAHVLEQKRDLIRSDAGLRSVYVNPSTQDVYEEGEKVKMPALAKTLKIIREEGANTLYNGTLKEIFIREIEERGGLITEEDLSSYKVEWSEPITVTLPDNRTLHTANLPGSGVILAFMMNLLKGLVHNSDPNAAVTYQRIVESFKFGYGKRTHFGDYDFLSDETKNLARNLTEDSYADHLRQSIFDGRTSQDPEYYGAELALREDHGTANIAVLAPNGDAVVATSTINLYFGSGLLLPKTGIILNDEMDDFSSPNQTNEFGLPPSPNNFIKPHKRPMSSMAPTIILKDGNVEMLVGAAGGSKITTSIALIIIRHLWFNMTLEEAISEKRFHHQLIPMELTFEKAYQTTDHQIVEALEKIGHKITFADESGFSAATGISNKSGIIRASHDWRRQGSEAYFRER